MKVWGMSKEPEPDAFAMGLSNRLFFRLYQCANMMHKTGTNALAEHRATTQQWAVIGALARPGFDGMTVGDLAAFLLVSRQNLTGVLTRLEAQGYIERSVDLKDNRGRRIRLSDAGAILWRDRLTPEIGRYYQAALDGFSTDDKIHALHYLGKLLENMKKLDAAR